MNIGKMRYRLNLQEQSTAYDNERIAVESWPVTYSFWADMRPIGGEIAFQQYGISADGITKRVYCRPNSKIKEGCRVIHGADTYEVCYVADYHEHYEVLLRPL